MTSLRPVPKAKRARTALRKARNARIRPGKAPCPWGRWRFAHHARSMGSPSRLAPGKARVLLGTAVENTAAPVSPAIFWSPLPPPSIPDRYGDLGTSGDGGGRGSGGRGVPSSPGTPPARADAAMTQGTGSPPPPSRPPPSRPPPSRPTSATWSTAVSAPPKRSGVVSAFTYGGFDGGCPDAGPTRVVVVRLPMGPAEVEVFVPCQGLRDSTEPIEVPEPD